MVYIHNSFNYWKNYANIYRSTSARMPQLTKRAPATSLQTRLPLSLIARVASSHRIAMPHPTRPQLEETRQSTAVDLPLLTATHQDASHRLSRGKLHRHM